MDVISIMNGKWEFRVEHKGIKIFSSKVSGSEIFGFKEKFSKYNGTSDALDIIMNQVKMVSK